MPAALAPHRRSAPLGGRLALVLALSCGLAAACSPKPRNWVACYNAQIPIDTLQGFDLVVVDAGYLGDIGVLKARGAKVLAYVSLGEVATHRGHFARARAAGLLIQENPNWKGAWMVDVRKPAWHALIADEVVPPLRARGFDGLFLDTVDSALALEQTRPAAFAGMAQGVVALVGRLRAQHPGLRLMLNGALPLVGRLRGQVDMVAMESTLTTWDFQTARARWRTDDELRWVRDVVGKARADNPDLQLFSLDYWDLADADGVRRIYARQRALGMVPYVSTIALDRVHAEPVPPAERRAVAPVDPGKGGPAP